MAVSWNQENASQESLNAWTHGAGFALSIPAGIFLNWLVRGQASSMVWACLIYTLSLSAMYLFSTLSHAIREPLLRRRIRALDQGFVYTLIAGTFTPFICAYLEGWTRFALMAMVWLAAAFGFFSKVFTKHRIDNMASLSYILLGWVPAMLLFPHVPWECFGWMALGGILYTFGVAFLQNDHRGWYFHAIWHTLVIVASACHFYAVLIFAALR